uniref:Sugar phosphate isomerase/epimerase n=1 Tax=Schlesneria paludicola TaxID=360056 RepID=A0A7C4LP88_9PLAN
MLSELSRRQWLGVAAAAAASTAVPASAAPSRHGGPFRYCLNTSTIREQKLGIVAEVELAAKVGYDGIEPWIRELDEYVQQGGSLSDLRKRIADAGLTVESAIGFAPFLHEDPVERQKGLEEARRSMDLVRQIGGTRIAAPPVGVTDKTGLDPFALAERYYQLCELGQRMEVLPQLELWGFSKTLSRLGEVAFTGIEAAHPAACLLLDVYHIYKGGSSFAGLTWCPGTRMYCFHMNDYPADPPRETIADRHRVYPGDGVAPLGDVLRTLHAIGFRGALSLELFNPEYWKQDAELVARTGLEKMRAAVQRAFA